MKLTIGDADFELPEGSTIAITIPVLARAPKVRPPAAAAAVPAPVQATNGGYVDVDAEPRIRKSERRTGAGPGRKVCPNCNEIVGARTKECMCGKQFPTA